MSQLEFAVLVTELVEALASATNEEAVARHAFGVFEARLGLVRLEIAGWAAPAAVASVLVVVGGGAEPGRRTRRLAVSLLARAEGHRGPFVIGAGESPVEARIAASSGAEVVAVVPLEGGRFVLLYLREACEWVSWQAVGGILKAALQSVRRLGRVASLSRQAHRESRRLRQSLAMVEAGSLVAESPSMQRVLEQVDLVAQHDTSVLLRGESGTGKELLARRLHRLSGRADRAMVMVNCGALPADLIESALFGHEAGAFTGALKRRLGRFERADRGTLFLDEVAELPLSAQVKLLRILQEGVLERVGGQSPVKVDARIIAATHRPLEEMVAEGRFREDLFYRLNVFPIHIPPLRARGEDIAPLVDQILASLSGKMGRVVPEVSEADLRRLAEHPWPGNVRQLENTLERALILGPDDVLRLPPLDGAVPSPPVSAQPETWEAGTRRLIEAALWACRGRIYGPAGAALRLGLKPGTLQSKMKRLGIARELFVGGGERRSV